jgi:hypothetical protein
MNQLLNLARLDRRDFLALVFHNYQKLHWEVQGFGMLRTYITSHEVRLHVWDSRLKVPNVSLIHTHPWDFTSVCLNGRIRNVKFVEEPGEPNHAHTTILCGKEAKIARPEKTILPVRLKVSSTDVYEPGDFYEEEAHEIHLSQPEDGTITLVERHTKTDPDHAKVYWDLGTDWVSAKPRDATPYEVEAVVNGLKLWI